MTDGILLSVGLMDHIRTCGSYPFHENVNFDLQNLHGVFAGCTIRRQKCV